MASAVEAHKTLPIFSIISEQIKRIEWNTGFTAANNVAWLTAGLCDRSGYTS